LRTAWTDEARDFTPWLAQEDNLALLGEAIGLELELERVEMSVGPYRADILCKDTLTGNWVLIENQLERTDHSHLGQLLTYAAGLNAVTIVWIAARITDEHRAALDWLNDITGEDINFFGLEIQLWRIGGSHHAPKFNIVSQPNDWTKAFISHPPSGNISPTKQLQLDYWTALNADLEEIGFVKRPRKPQPQHWMDYPVGRTDFCLSAAVNTREKFITVELRLFGPYAKAYFDLLHAQRAEIEAELGEKLHWHKLLDKKESQIGVNNPHFDPADRSTWPQQHVWLREKLEALHRVFAPRVKALDASDYIPEPIETPDILP